VVDLGDWGIRHWRLLSGLTTVLLVATCALVGALSEYTGSFPALGGPNGPLFDLTLRIAEPARRKVPTVPAVFVAIDDTSLASPELTRLPRALFQPVWARLIDGLVDAGARRIAFDVVFAYAGADLQVDEFRLPDYDRSLIDSLARHRDRVVLGRFPSVPPAPIFVRTMGASRIGVLDLRVESDGRVRSAAPLTRLPDGRISLGFAALGAGLTVRQASAAERLLVTPHAPLAATPTYELATLLGCLASPEDAARVREAVQGRIVVIGTAVLGEDEHRGPTRFFGHAAHSPSGGRCAPQSGLFNRAEPEVGPGALLQIAAIQSAASERPVRLAPMWLRASAGAVLALIFAVLAFRDESALTIGERDVAPGQTVMLQLVRSFATGVLGPLLLGSLAALATFVLADLWLPMGYPMIATVGAFGAIVGIRSMRHRMYFRRLYRTTGRYLPPARLVTLARTGFADPEEGQEREVSILLVDLVGFTSFSNEPNRTASEVVRVANRYFTAMQAAIDRHDGCSDKFLGDAVLAFWNGLSDEPKHALKALAAAREIIDTLRHPTSPDEFRLGARAVVCSGRVYVGDLGAKQRSNFTIIGPAVNETFRLEKVPDQYGLPLLVAEATARLIEAARDAAAEAEALAGHLFVRIDDIDLKGFAAPESVYTLVPHDDPGLAAFQAGRQALDEGRIEEGLALLAKIDSGMLQRAARVVSGRHAKQPAHAP
jgi:adenylate cyclase